MLFLLLCIPARLLLAALLTSGTLGHLAPLIAACIGAGLLYLYLASSRLSAPESTVGCTWWHSLRPVHAMLWLISGWLLLQSRPQMARYCLLLDIFVGVIGYVSMRSPETCERLTET